MFDNIGGKIKTLAKVVCWIGIIGSCLAGFVLLVEGLDVSEELILYGILVAGVGSLFSWIGSFFLYGFGQLIENTDVLVKQGQIQQPQAPATPYAAPVQISTYTAPTSYCTRCGAVMVNGVCPHCHQV